MSDKKVENLELTERRIAMEDGRYMIFYTFGDGKPARPPGSPAADPEPNKNETRKDV